MYTYKHVYIHVYVCIIKHRFMGPELIWPNKPIGVTVAFEEILAFISISHKVSNQRGIVQTKCSI